MEVVLYNYKSGQYVRFLNSRAELTSIESKAKRFGLEAAKNYRSQNLANALRGVNADDFDIRLAGTGKLMVLAPSRGNVAPGEEYLKGEQSMSREEAYEQLTILKASFPQIASILANMDTIKAVVEADQLRAEGAIQDILHKAEFEDLGAADGFKLYRLLHDKRRERRRAKDALRIVDCMSYELRALAQSAGERLRADDAYDETRSYVPRELPELFQDKDKKTVA